MGRKPKKFRTAFKRQLISAKAEKMFSHLRREEKER